MLVSHFPWFNNPGLSNVILAIATPVNTNRLVKEAFLRNKYICTNTSVVRNFNCLDSTRNHIIRNFNSHYTFIAQFGGRHEDLSHPENSCRPRAKPEGDMNFLGGTNLRVSRLTGQLIVYYTESCSTTLYSAERCAVIHNRETRRLEGNTTICSPSTWLL